MGSEALVQAGIRLVIIFVTAGLASVGANLTILRDSVSDPILSALVVSVATSVISAVLKFLGGPTQPGPAIRGRSAEGAEAPRPNPFAI